MGKTHQRGNAIAIPLPELQRRRTRVDDVLCDATLVRRVRKHHGPGISAVPALHFGVGARQTHGFRWAPVVHDERVRQDRSLSARANESASQLSTFVDAAFDEYRQERNGRLPRNSARPLAQELSIVLRGFVDRGAVIVELALTESE